jgi:cytochrome c oxidase subunit 4
MSTTPTPVDSRHAPTPRAFVLALSALLALLVVTVAIAQLEVGRLALALAIVIAAIKAAIVLFVFMELGGAANPTRAAAVLCLFTAALLGGLSYLDWGDRDRGLESGQAPVRERAHVGSDR